jgi:transcriptional antiterminator NusG
MYYVMFVGTGQEDKIKQMIEQMVPDSLYQECFYPMRVMKKKIRGKWLTTRERLTPGYLFIRTDHILAFYKSLRLIPGLTQLLGMDQEVNNQSLPEEQLFYCLPQKEEEWLLKMTGQDRNPVFASVKPDSKSADSAKEYTLGLSQVAFDENDQVVILSGPLVGMEGRIKKINLHKRRAEVEVVFMGRKTIFYMGIELLDIVI